MTDLSAVWRFAKDAFTVAMLVGLFVCIWVGTWELFLERLID